MKALLRVLLISMSFTSFSFAVANPCLIRDPLTVPVREIPELDPKIELLFVLDPQEAVKIWLIGLDRFKSKSESLKIEKISVPGRYNSGVFLVSYGHLTFAVKTARTDEETQGREEIERLYQLNETIYTHPECLISETQRESGFPVPTTAELEKLPRLSKILDASCGIKYCFSLLEKAPGKSFHDFLKDRYPKLLEGKEDLNAVKPIFKQLGETFGRMHFFFSNYQNRDIDPFEDLKTLSHGDLHSHNFFINEDAGHLTLIDSGGLSFGTTKTDLYQLAWGIFRKLGEGLLQIWLSLMTYEPPKKYSHQWDDRVEIGPKWEKLTYDQQVNHQLSSINRITKQKSHYAKNELAFSIYISLMRSFFHGYLEQYPAYLRSKIQEVIQFGCNELFGLSLASKLEYENWTEEDQNKLLVEISNLEKSIPELAKCIAGDFD